MHSGGMQAGTPRTTVDPDGISPGLAAQIQRLLDGSAEFARGYRAVSRLLGTAVTLSPTDVADLVEVATWQGPFQPGTGDGRG
jgi:hypothetical protein